MVPKSPYPTGNGTLMVLMVLTVLRYSLYLQSYGTHGSYSTSNGTIWYRPIVTIWYWAMGTVWNHGTHGSGLWYQSLTMVSCGPDNPVVLSYNTDPWVPYGTGRMVPILEYHTPPNTIFCQGTTHRFSYGSWNGERQRTHDKRSPFSDGSATSRIQYGSISQFYGRIEISAWYCDTVGSGGCEFCKFWIFSRKKCSRAHFQSQKLISMNQAHSIASFRFLSEYTLYRTIFSNYAPKMLLEKKKCIRAHLHTKS